jgi:hypothetical protein
MVSEKEMKGLKNMLFLLLEITKFAQLVAVEPVKKKDKYIMTIVNNPKKTVQAIKNTHTKAQLDEMSNRFTTHKGPFLNLQQVLEIEAQPTNTKPA